MTPDHNHTPDSPAASVDAVDAVDAALGLVCTLPPTDRAGRRVSVQYLLERATGWTGHEDGVLLEFPGSDDVAHALLDFVLAERQCCAHFTYELGFAPNHQQVTLRLRANGIYRVALKTMYSRLARQAGVHART